MSTKCWESNFSAAAVSYTHLDVYKRQTEVNVSQRLIGLTIIAFGTSLPELVTSVTALSLIHI